jgi:hypothetical protein
MDIKLADIIYIRIPLLIPNEMSYTPNRNLG